MADKGKFLMRRIEYTPDKVNIYCDIKIKWLQEIYFKSIIYSNSVLFEQDNFKYYEIKDTFISIDISDWTILQKNIVSIFRNNKNERRKVIERANSLLRNARVYTDGIFENTLKGNLPSRDEIKELIELFIKMDTFSIFNIYIPHEYYKKLLGKYNNLYSIDDFMICAFEPHRMRVNKSKMNLAIKELVSDEELEEYKLNYMAFEEFEKWIFDIERFKNNIYLKRELRKMAKSFSKQELQNEIKSEIDNRNKQLLNFKRILKEIEKSGVSNYEDDLDCLGFLSVIVSEEEMRHMIECKILVVLRILF